MWFGIEKRYGLTLSLNIGGWFSLLLILTSVGVYLFSWHLLDESLEEDWDYTHVHTKSVFGPGETAEAIEIQIEEQYGRAKLNEAMRSYIGRTYKLTWFLVALPILVLSIALGFGLTYARTLPGRRVIGVVHDILETGDLSRRVKEEGIRKDMRGIVSMFNQLLERNDSLVRAMHDTLDNVAHDLRTPMTRLRATAERALQHPEDSEAAREAIADCMEESERLLTMLNTLMEVAEAETGAMRLERSLVNLDDLVREIVELYEFVAEDRGVKLVTHLEEGLALTADANRLRQALANLVDNAIKYGGEGGEVSLDARIERGRAIVRISDKGPGIPAEDEDRIWERLYRGDRSRTEKGLGLGLSFVRAVVEAHRGEVTLENTPGGGATFVVSLPLR